MALWAICTMLLLAVARHSHFAILANDAFPLLFQASSLSLSDTRSFYNGFFPIGYPLMLRGLLLFGRQHIDATGIMVNILFMLPLIWCLVKLFLLQGWNRWWALLGAASAIFLPEMLRGVLSLRPDYIVTSLATAALLSLHHRRYGLTGLFLGLPCLFRTHALVLVIAFAISSVIFRHWRSALRILIFAAPILLIQVLVNLAAGESPFSSAQGFNIAKMIQGADWRQDVIATPDAWDLTLEQPAALLRAYGAHLMSEWYLLLGLAIALFFKRTREFSLIALLYFLGVGFGGSPRGSLPIQPIVVLCIFGMFRPLVPERATRSLVIPIAGICALLIGSSVLLFKSASNAGARIERYQDVGDRLGLQHVDDAKRILTDDFAMYFPQIENASPYVNGGWGPIGIPLYRERMPQFMYDDASQLHDSLAAHGVRMIVIAQPSSDPRLAATVAKDGALFMRQPDINRYAVYKVR